MDFPEMYIKASVISIDWKNPEQFICMRKVHETEALTFLTD